jgi:uroporphyrinogen decarboxylase
MVEVRRLNHRDRVYAALDRQEPDKVPKGELGIAPDLVSRLLGSPPDDPRAGLRRCLELLHMDVVNTGLAGPPAREVGRDPEGRTIYEDQWGLRSVHEEASVRWDPAITDAQDAWSYEVPTPDMYDSADTAWWTKETDYFVFGQTGGCHDSLLALFGWENAMIYSQTDLPVVKDLARRIGSLHAELGRMAAEAGANLVLVGDDIAFNSGTFFSPDALREIVFPVLKDVVREIKKSGVPVMFHADGNLNAVMEDIVDCGFDALQSLQPSAGMDIAKIKANYGDKLCLMGNMDLDWVMPRGTTDQVREAVRSVIRAAAPGGGLILSTCNILTRDIPAENALAMYDEAERFGRYPIRR